MFVKVKTKPEYPHDCIGRTALFIYRSKRRAGTQKTPPAKISRPYHWRTEKQWRLNDPFDDRQDY